MWVLTICNGSILCGTVLITCSKTLGPLYGMDEPFWYSTLDVVGLSPERNTPDPTNFVSSVLWGFSL